jgi:hypothetical protein
VTTDAVEPVLDEECRSLRAEVSHLREQLRNASDQNE